MDAPDRIEALLDELEPIMDSELVTLERVRLVRYGDETGLA